MFTAGGSVGIPSSLITTPNGRKAMSELGHRDPHQLSTPPNHSSTLRRNPRRPQVSI